MARASLSRSAASTSHLGKDPFGDKEVAWIQANITVYRIEIEAVRRG